MVIIEYKFIKVKKKQRLICIHFVYKYRLHEAFSGIVFAYKIRYNKYDCNNFFQLLGGYMNLYNKINEGKTYIIAEMSANHAGSIDRAKEIIHAAKDAGADCIKIQTYTADTITIDCDNEYFNLADGTWKGENLYQLYKKAYTPWEWQVELKTEAEKIGLDFLSTPFDKTAVDFLEDLGVEFYKIASFELIDIPLIDYVASKNKPIVISTGMGTLEEIEEAVATIRKYHNNIVLLKCSSAYPAISDDMNLNTMVDVKNKFLLPVGLSDHSMGALGAVVAVSMGASVVEKHFCISREVENADSSFSMEPKEFASMVEDIRMVEKAKGAIYYGCSKQEESNYNSRKSIFVVKDIKQGEDFTEENIRVIRPGYGLHPREYINVIGKKATCSLKKGTPLKAEHFS